MMVPPHLSQWQWFHPTAQDTRGTVTPQHNPDSSGVSLLFALFEGDASEDQTYRWLPVTHHHYISAHTTFLRVHFQEGIG